MGCELESWSDHIHKVILSLPMIQEGQLSVTNKSVNKLISCLFKASDRIADSPNLTENC